MPGTTRRTPCWRTWPALRTISQQLIGFNEDVWIFFWNNWWFREALSSGQNPFETGYLFYPTGASLVAHSNSFTSSFLALLLEPLSGPIAAYNLALLAGLWLGALDDVSLSSAYECNSATRKTRPAGLGASSGFAPPGQSDRFGCAGDRCL